MQNFTRIGTLGLLAIVALRIGIGWHFFKEGTDKIKTGTFSSEGFLKAAQGRMAGFYHGMVWDYDGSIRLDSQLMLAKMDEGVQAATRHFGLTQEQIGKLEQQKTKLAQKLKDVYLENSEAILKFDKGKERNERMESAVWNEVSTLRGHREKIEKERLAAVWPALQSIDAIWAQYEQVLNQAATPEQRTSGYFSLARPGEGLVSAKTVDRIIPIFDVTVGVLLILGLFVPLAGWAAAAFLLSVVLSQWPGDPNTTPTYLYAVEGLALVFLASIGAGRFAGLDFFWWALRQNKKSAKPA